MPSYAQHRVDGRRMASYVGDNRLRKEAKAEFLKKNWYEVIEKIESVQYPQYLEKADIKRLEISRKRIKSRN